MVKFFATEIHGESHSHINVHTGNVPHSSVFSNEFFFKCIASETILLEDFYPCDGP